MEGHAACFSYSLCPARQCRIVEAAKIQKRANAKCQGREAARQGRIVQALGEKRHLPNVKVERPLGSVVLSRLWLKALPNVKV